jgi:lipoate-protein ligase A
MRYLDHTFPGIAENLALDEALLIAAEERAAGPSLRLWEPNSLAVVLGASSRLSEEVHVESCRAEGVAIARRASGGGTVVIGPGTLNATVVLPSDFAPGLTAVDTSQTFVLDRIAEALRKQVPAVEVLGRGDLTIGGRKFAGSAQRRLRRHFLVHLTILYRFPLEQITRYTPLPPRQPAYRAQRSHADFLINLDLSRDHLVAALRSAWIPEASSAELVPIPDDLVCELIAAKYGDPAWVERFL